MDEKSAESINMVLESINNRCSEITNVSKTIRSTLNKALTEIQAFCKEQRELEEEQNAISARMEKSIIECVAKEQAQIRDCRAREKENEKTMREHRHNVEDIGLQISELKKQAHEFPIQQQKLQENVDNQCEKIANRDSQIEQMTSRVKAKEDSLVQTYNVYQKALALHVKVLSRTTMRFIFTEINVNFPLDEFSTTVSITQDSEEYTAKDCNPMVPEFSALSEELSRTGSLETYIRKIRYCFKKLYSNDEEEITQTRTSDL